MKKHGKLLLKYLLLFVMTVFVMGCFSVSAATKTGFVTQKGKTYYINKDGSKQKGWLELKGKKYYFNKKTGVQVKGWVKDSSGQAIRYFTSGAGYMVTGFITDSNGNTFDTKTDSETFSSIYFDSNDTGDDHWNTSGESTYVDDDGNYCFQTNILLPALTQDFTSLEVTPYLHLEDGTETDLDFASFRVDYK